MVGRALPGIVHHGFWQIRMVSDPDNTGFAGFNLKSAALSGFGESEVIRVRMTPAPIASMGKGMSVSTNGGKTCPFLDWGRADGRSESIVYQIYWDEGGRCTLTMAWLSGSLRLEQDYVNVRASLSTFLHSVREMLRGNSGEPWINAPRRTAP